MMIPKPNVKVLGSCVVERDGKGFLVMFSDGSVRAFRDYAKAIHSINRHFAKLTPKDSIGVGQIKTYDGSISVKVIRNGFVTEVF